MIEANKNVQITATLAGADNDVVQFSWKADQNGGGAFSPAQGSQQLGATGSGTLTTNYQAPTLAGGFGQTLTVSSSNGQQVKSFNVNIAVPQYIGYPTAFSPSLMASTSANFLIGEQVTASAAATVVRLGFISGAPSQNVQLAMYSDLGGKPDILVAATAVVPVIQGANEIAVTQPYLLSSGSSYWLMAVFSASTLALQSTSTNTNGEYIAFSIETSLPSPYPTTPPAMFGTYNFYAVTLE